MHLCVSIESLKNLSRVIRLDNKLFFILEFQLKDFDNTTTNTNTTDNTNTIENTSRTHGGSKLPVKTEKNISYLTASRPTLGHIRRDSLTQAMSITAHLII